MSSSATTDASMQIRFARFNELDIDCLYALAKLRIDVFVVEQACAYAELDGRDINADTVHILGYVGNEFMAYARILGLPQDAASIGISPVSEPIWIGRIIVSSAFRRQGYATALMQHAIQHATDTDSERCIQLAAQVTVQPFYQSLGFEPVSDIYREDGIDHIDMQLKTDRNR